MSLTRPQKIAEKLGNWIYGSWKQGGAVLILVLAAIRCANDIWGSNPWLMFQLVPIFMLIALFCLATLGSRWHRIFGAFATIVENTGYAWGVSTILLFGLAMTGFRANDMDAQLFGYGMGLILFVPLAIVYVLLTWASELLEPKTTGR